MLLEQVLFTSACTAKADGYQVTAASPGVSEVDARALAVWCPSHDALRAESAARSVNFHGLPSGLWCVSLTTPAGEEYSGRGDRLHTHCVLVAAEDFARFSNDPFAVLRAAEARGLFDSVAPRPEHFPSFSLPGRAGAVNVPLVEQVVSELGPEPLATAVEAVLASPAVAVVGGPSLERFVAALIACLPLELRPAVSFSTGLKFSLSRPFRLAGAESDLGRRRRQLKDHCAALIDLDEPQTGDLGGWGQFLAACLGTGQVQLLAAQLVQPRPGLQASELGLMGERLARLAAIHPQPATMLAVQKHAAHERFVGTAPARHCATPSPSLELARQAPEIVERLEELDDAVYDSVALKPGAIGKLMAAWPRVRAELTTELIEESRERYLAYALGVWDEFRRRQSHPERAAAALEVLSILADG